MSIWDEIHYMMQEEDECLHRKETRYPKLTRALLSGNYKEVYLYCLERSLPPLIERPKMTSEELTFHISRAGRWYHRLVPLAKKIWGNHVDTVPPQA